MSWRVPRDSADAPCATQEGFLHVFHHPETGALAQVDSVWKREWSQCVRLWLPSIHRIRTGSTSTRRPPRPPGRFRNTRGERAFAPSRGLPCCSSTRSRPSTPRRRFPTHQPGLSPTRKSGRANSSSRQAVVSRRRVSRRTRLPWNGGLRCTSRRRARCCGWASRQARKCRHRAALLAPPRSRTANKDRCTSLMPQQKTTDADRIL